MLSKEDYPMAVDDTERARGPSILFSSAILLTRHLLGLAFNFVGGVLLARILGPHIWGIFAICMFLSVAVQLILEKGLVAFLVQSRKEPPNYEIGTAFTIQMLAGGVIVVFLILWGAPALVQWYGFSELRVTTIGMAIGTFAYSLRAIPVAMLERKMAYSRVGLIELSDIIAFNLIAVSFALLGKGIEGLALGLAFRGIISALLAFVLGVRPSFAWDYAAAVRLLRFGVPFFLSNSTRIIISAAEPVLIGLIAGTAALGIVQLSYSLLSYPGMIALIVSRVLFSANSRLQDDLDAFVARAQQTVIFLSQIVTPAVTLLAAFSPWWITIVYGPDWHSVSLVMLLAALPFAFGNVIWTLSASLFAKGRVMDVLVFQVVYACLYWVFNLIFIPRIGLLGAPLALLCSNPCFLMLVLAFKRIGGQLKLLHLVLYNLAYSFLMIAIWVSVESGRWIVALALLAFFIMFWTISSTELIEQLRQLLVLVLKRQTSRPSILE